ncbi:MAG: aminoacyl-tRNA hydrolase [bacterium]
MMYLVGLGNPGDTYHRTRHNAGFQAIEYMADNESFTKKLDHSVALIKGKFVLVKPTTFMNLSGLAVQELISYYKPNLHDLLVICDDFTLPLGVIRLRQDGSSGGHKGLQSIIDMMQSNNFARIRIGVGPVPEKKDPAAFVLEKMNSSDFEILTRMSNKAAECIEYLMTNDIEKAMNKFNKSHIDEQ